MKPILVLCFTLCIILFYAGCRKNEETPLSDFIEGHVVEDYTGNPVPFAYVGVQMEKWINLWNEELTVVDTIEADSEGRFQLDRAKYHQLDEANGAVSFFACADGPDLNGVDVYSDNCAEGGTLVYPNEQQDVVCKVYTKGWIQVFVEDIGPPNPEITSIHVHQPWSGGEIFGYYPTAYFPDTGFIQILTGYKNYQIPIEFFTNNDGIPNNDSLSHISAFSEGLDTVKVYVEY